MLCETFGGYPDEAWAAWQRLPVGTLEGILEYRAYSAAKARVEAADTAEARQRLSKDTWAQRVSEIDMELAHEALKAKRAAAERK